MLSSTSTGMASLFCDDLSIVLCIFSKLLDKFGLTWNHRSSIFVIIFLRLSFESLLAIFILFSSYMHWPSPNLGQRSYSSFFVWLLMMRYEWVIYCIQFLSIFTSCHVLKG